MAFFMVTLRKSVLITSLRQNVIKAIQGQSGKQAGSARHAEAMAFGAVCAVIDLALSIFDPYLYSVCLNQLTQGPKGVPELTFCDLDRGATYGIPADLAEPNNYLPSPHSYHRKRVFSQTLCAVLF
jgi:hypothetical protein